MKDPDAAVSLGEGGTALVQSKTRKGYYFKNEATNPTGSFKDRGSTVEISKALEFGVKEVACASTGNMGASVAAYCARAGIKSTIYLPTFAPKVKANQIASYDSKVVNVRGTYQDAVEKTLDLRHKKHVYLTGDYVYRGEGEKSVGFEIIDQLNWEIPNYIVVPVGNATLFSATYKALHEMKAVGLIDSFPKLIGVQAAGCQPLVSAWKRKEKVREVKKPKTVASAIACGDPVDALKAQIGLKKTKGKMVSVTDAEILSARREIGKEGLFVEPSGAVSYAGAKKLGLRGNVVCVLTGHGLKDSKIY